jgi:Ca2+-binding EF-hand superfamily protein
MRDHNISNATALHNKIDKDKNSFLDRKELSSFCKNDLKLNLDFTSLSILLNFFDKNKDNKISVSEFVSIMMKDDQ